MHVLKHKTPKATPLVPVVSHWKTPGHRKMRGRRFDSAGNDIGPCGPPKPVPDVRDRENLLKAQRAAALLPPPEETGGFDLAQYRPLPGRILVKRPPPVTHEKGIAIPPDKQRSEDWFWVVKVGAGVTVCQPGDRVIFGRKSKPKPIRLGQPFHLGRASAVAALVDIEDSPATP